MHIPGGPFQLDVNTQSELAGALNDVSIDEMDEDFAGEEVDEADESEETSKLRKKKRSGKKGDIAKKKRSNKPTSLALLSGEISDKELLNEQSDKAAKSRLKKTRDAVYKKFQKEFKESAAEQLKTGSNNRSKDIISISSSFQQEKLQKAKDAATSKSFKPSTSIADDLRRGTEMEGGNENKLQKNKKMKALQSNKQKVSQNRALTESLQQYVGSFSEALLEEKPKKKEEVRQLRQKLQSEGLSTKKLKVVEKNVQRYIRKDLKSKLKQSFIETTMFYATDKNSRDTISKFYNYKELLKLGESLGVLDEGLQTEKTYKDDIKTETRAYIAYELDASLAETRLKTHSVKDLVQVFDKFNKLAGFSNFKAADYMKDLNKKLDDQGLLPFLNPNAGQQSYLDTQSGQNKKKRDQTEEEREDEIDSLEESLRKLYIKNQTSSPSPLALAKMKLKMMSYEKKLRAIGKGLIVDQLKQESSRIAVFKLTVKLRETFEERATFPELKGTQYKLNKKQLKATLKGLKKCGNPVTKSDMINVRDQANRSIFTLVKEEYIKLEVHHQATPNDHNISMKIKEYKQILDRLREESNINESIKPKLMQDLSFLSDLNIVEAA